MTAGRKVISLSREQCNILVVRYRVVRPPYIHNHIYIYTQKNKMDSAYTKYIYTHVPTIKKKRLPTWGQWRSSREGSWEGWREGEVM